MRSYRFGDFELNEDTRSLRFGSSEIPVQPRVFDLLAYLMRHRDRVVSKDELMDALWPGVVVTEASLQRAASLARGALRQGGLDGAIRSFPRYGYRFCIDCEDGGVSPEETKPVGPAEVANPDDSPLQRARALMGQKQWAAAIRAFEEADAADLVRAADLDAWALAIECDGRPSDAIDVLTRAVTAYGMGGNRLGAAKPALVLAKIHLERGDVAVAKGWHKRAVEFIGANTGTREDGLACWMEARIAAAEKDQERALALSERAYEIGKALSDPEVEAVGLIYRGFFRVCLGETRQGLEDQDHAAALALSSDVDPIVGGTIYCNILWACRNLGDWSRANQWSLGYQRWCKAGGITNYSGACQLHRAEVLSVQGTFEEAETRIFDAMRRLPEDAPWALGDAHRILGDICLARGEYEKAEAAYQEAYAVGWDPQPGYAMLQLERGDGEAAFRGLARAMIGRGWGTMLRQGILLAHLALVAARIGKVERAEEIIRELEGEPDRWSTPSILALIAQAKAGLSAGRGDPAEAIGHLERARELWSDLGSPYNATDVRLSIAELLLEQGDRAGAEMELRAAATAAGRLASPKLVDRCDGIQRGLATMRDAAEVK